MVVVMVELAKDSLKNADMWFSVCAAGCELVLREGSEEVTPSLKMLLPEKKLGLTAMDAVVRARARV